MVFSLLAGVFYACWVLKRDFGRLNKVILSVILPTRICLEYTRVNNGDDMLVGEGGCGVGCTRDPTKHLSEVRSCTILSLRDSSSKLLEILGVPRMPHRVFRGKTRKRSHVLRIPMLTATWVLGVTN